MSVFVVLGDVDDVVFVFVVDFVVGFYVFVCWYVEIGVVVG